MLEKKKKSIVGLDIDPLPAVADTAMLLSSEESGQRESRAVRVLKLRGGSYLSGRHAYRIGVDGSSTSTLFDSRTPPGRSMAAMLARASDCSKTS